MDILDLGDEGGRCERRKRLILYYGASDYSFREALAKFCGFPGFEEYAAAAVEERVSRDGGRIRELFEETSAGRASRQGDVRGGAGGRGGRRGRGGQSEP